MSFIDEDNLEAEMEFRVPGGMERIRIYKQPGSIVREFLHQVKQGLDWETKNQYSIRGEPSISTDLEVEDLAN